MRFRGIVGVENLLQNGVDSGPRFRPANTLTFQAQTIRDPSARFRAARHHAREIEEEMKRSYLEYAMSADRGSALYPIS